VRGLLAVALYGAYRPYEPYGFVDLGGFWLARIFHPMLDLQ